MSDTIDNRVVEMRFDNKDFESNVQTSLTTLDKLKNSLNLPEASKGLENIGDAAKRISFGGLSSGIETIGSRFSAMEVVAITALQNITNSAINTGRQMLNSLTVEPIKEGFSEYELKMDSVQTIMNGTGESLDVVMEKLNELNTYADKTIYSFSDMTSSIGKFTNAGVKLDDAVAAIQGVSNLAAVSGSNAQQASHAMYNFAQALSSGSVKLIDWKSIENANMATVEFKNELLKTALELGTVTEKEGKFITTTTDAKGKISDAFDAVTGFNDSLSNNWMTTDVLTTTLAKYSDETTELGQRAYAAAQDVKTFTQLMGTIKEAVGSGWAETWEIVFGDFNEAKKLWTGVNNVLGGFVESQSKARNAMLENWKLLGGRTDIIEAIKNIFEGLSPIAKNVADAFREVFKPITGIQLADASKALKDLTEKFQLSGYTLQKIKNTFRGFFSLLDIGWQGVKAIAESLMPLIRMLPGFGDGVLDITSDFGLWITSLDESIKKNDTFKNSIEGVISFLESAVSSLEGIFQSLTGMTFTEAFDKLVDVLSEARNAVSDFMDSFKGIDTSGMKTVATDIQSPFTPLISMFDGIRKLFSGVVTLLQNTVVPIVSSLFTEVGQQLGFFGEQVSNAANNIDVNKILTAINGGLLVAIGLKIKQFISSLTEGIGSNGGILSKIKGIFDGIKDVLDGVCDSLKVWQQDLKAGTLLKIAGAVGILTGSILLLSGIEPEKVGHALGAMTTAFVELLGAMAFIDKALGDSDGKSLNKMAKSMIKISAAMLIFSFAIGKLGTLSPEQLTAGLVGMAAALYEVYAFLALTKASDISKSASGLIGLGIAMNVFVKAIDGLGKMSPDQLIKGLIGLGGALLEIYAFLSLTKSSDVTKAAGGLIGLGIAMNIFVKAIESLGSLSPEQLIYGLAGLGAALLEVYAFLSLTKSSDVTKAAGGLIGLGIAMNIFVKAIQSLGSMPIEQLGVGLLGLGAALAFIAFTANAMNGTLAGAASMLVMAGALAILCPILKVFGAMPLEQIGKSLLILAGAFAVIGIAGTVLAPIVPVILALAGSIALFGAGALACGVAVGVLAAGLAALGTAGVVGIGALVLVIKSVIALIPEILQSIGTGLLLVVAAIGNAAPTITGAIQAILIAISQAIINASPEVVAAAVTLIGALLTGIVQLVPAVVEAAGQIIVGFLQGLAIQLPTIIQAGVELVVAFINGVAEALRGNAGPLFEAVSNLLSSLIELVLTGIQTIVQAIPVVGDSLSSGLESVKNGIRDTLAPGEMKSAASDAISGITSGIKDNEADVKKATSAIGDTVEDGLTGDGSKWSGEGRDIIDEFAGGMTSSSGKVSSAVDSIGDTIDDGLTSIDFDAAGSNSIEIYARSFSGGGGTIDAAVSDVVSSATNGLDSGKANFASSGKTDLDGYINGITSKRNEAGSASKKVAFGAARSADSQKSKFGAAGGHAGDGYVGGIRSKFDEAYQAGYTLGKKAKQGTADAQRSASPSKEFMKLGIYADQGYIKGLLSYTSRVSEAGAGVGHAALDSARGVLSRLAQSISSDFDTEPTIRPVLDLSDISAGAGSINRMLSGNYSFGATGNLGAISASMQENQNGASNDDVVNAIDKLRKDLSGVGNTTYHIDGITYDDGSNISEAIRTLVHAALVERRV